MEIDSRLTPIEKRFIVGWMNGMSETLGIPKEEMEARAEKRMDFLVATARKWRQDLLKVVQ